MKSTNVAPAGRKPGPINNNRRDPDWRIAGMTIFILRLIVGGVLCYAGFMKAVAPYQEFAAAIEAYKILPSALLSPLAFSLPWVEMWVGIFLVAGFMTRQAAMAASVLFVLFLGAVVSALSRGIDLSSCGCFGGEIFSPRHTMVMDLILLVISITLTLLKSRKQRFALD